MLGWGQGQSRPWPWQSLGAQLLPPLWVAGVLTQRHMRCRILSLACSPSGASFVCSAAAPSLAAQMDLSAPDIGSKGTNQVPGKLLLWDTKTMKQQVRACPVVSWGWSHSWGGVGG